MDIDFQAMSDEEFQAAAAALAVEQDRRARLAVIPDQIRGLTRTFVDCGGDLAALTLEPAAPPEPPASSRPLDPGVVEPPVIVPEAPGTPDEADSATESDPEA